MKNKAWLWVLARLFIGAIFTYAGFTKLLDPIENFRGAIAQYEVIPYSMVPMIAVILPWIEVIGGVMMITGYAPKVTASVIGSLCLGFLLILGSSDTFLSKGGHDCGCFGEGSLIHFTMYQIFAVDLLNFVLCIMLFRQKEHAFSLDSLLKKKED